MSTPSLKDLSKEQRSLLLFFEGAAVEHGGYLHTQHMNADDLTITKEWGEAGFVTMERIPFKKIEQMSSKFTHDVVLSPTAWSLAQEERRNRVQRIRDNRK